MKTTWEPMPYWEFICGCCGKGLFMEPAPEGALLGRCRNRQCDNEGLVVKVYPPRPSEPVRNVRD